MYEKTKWEGGIFYIKSTPDGEWRRAGEARQEAEVKALMEENERLRGALETLCFHWDQLLNNLDCGEEFEARQEARAALQDKSSGV